MIAPRPDQRFVDLVDELTHGTMSRWNFTQRVASLAGDGEATNLAWGGTVEFLARYLAG